MYWFSPTKNMLTPQISILLNWHTLQKLFITYYPLFSLVAKFAKISNRNLLGFCLLCALFGSILVGDWQSLSHDPCFSTSLSNGNNESGSEIGNYSYESGFESINSSEMSLYEQLLEDCEARSSSSHKCFFNSQSRITGEFCNTCRPTCLSKQASINFYQFTAGILLLSTAAPLGFVFTSAIASEITSIETQVDQQHI